MRYYNCEYYSDQTAGEAIFNIENTLRLEFKSNEFKITYIRELYYDN